MIKKALRAGLGYTFTRIILYLTIANFIMLAVNLYENTVVGEWAKEFISAPGDFVVIIFFIVFFISTLEYLIIGRNSEEF